ncbi:guanylate kinase [Tyzzerella sp. An114]|uniref:guanylate kinase n=1 Tax=Tyzzerella sp. An114 TaxID=1965545 RepID=UPI000B43DF72|nr:guanylate kinase [Tyzzerella sp. An114]OUQ58851.1 guanylate kinase [Tyzzerella sp. An114]HIT73590.1 guanylate kinase [Candidatus Fimicola cottocaccae]
MKKEGILLIISGPSGSGKGTVVSKLIEKGDFCLSISATTRQPRDYETDGVHYFFHTKEEFEDMRDKGELLEWASFCDNYYGTPKAYVEKCLKEGKNVILEIEVQGAFQVKKLMPESVLVFLMAPNVTELRNRLNGRGTEASDVIEKRVARAMEEMELVSEYDYVIINDTVEKAEKAVRTIVSAESMKTSRNRDINKVFKGEI